MIVKRLFRITFFYHKQYFLLLTLYCSINLCEVQGSNAEAERLEIYSDPISANKNRIENPLGFG